MLKKMEEEGNTIAYNREDSEVVFDEIYKIYQSKKVSLMLEGELLSGLKKNIKKLRNEMIETITRDLMEKFPQYFGKKHHSLRLSSLLIALFFLHASQLIVQSSV